MHGALTRPVSLTLTKCRKRSKDLYGRERKTRAIDLMVSLSKDTHSYINMKVDEGRTLVVVLDLIIVIV